MKFSVGHIKNRRRRALYYYRALLVYSLGYPNVRHYPTYPMPSVQSRNFLFTIQYSGEPPCTIWRCFGFGMQVYVLPE